MPKVFVLPDHIASQIAAGEVVERPASVVKELVENSIDAGATEIEIVVGSECRDIRIADNGSGMEPDDVVLAFQRHATSKLSSAEDLFSLNTMGFRGEALPSISSIAKVTCYTRASTSTTGTKVEAVDGKITATETGCAPGTVMEVTDLFYNVPARMKFLKKPSTEFGHIHETIQALTAAFPAISFSLLNEGEVILRTSGSGKLSQAMREAHLLSGDEELFEICYADPKFGMDIQGYVARPLHFRGDRKGILSIVNNRPVKCLVTYKALEQAFSDLIPRGKHPLAVLKITVNPQQVDVNVHPTKKEIKYSNGNDVYLCLQRALSQALRSTERPTVVSSRPYAEINHALTPRVSEAMDLENIPYRRPFVPVQQLRFPSTSTTATIGSAVLHRSVINPTLPEGWHFLGVVHNTYLIFETPEGIEIIEQHIAQERVFYERLLAEQETPGRLSENAQRLVISAPLNLTPQQIAVVQENLAALQQIGFDFEIQNQSSVVCTQVPLELAHKDYATVLQQIINDLSLTNKAAFQLEATKSVACQAAIKNGMPLSEQDIVQLIWEWHHAPRNDTCPHGRPIALKFSMDKLFQIFHP